MQLIESFFDERSIGYARIPEMKNRKTPDYSLFKLPYIFLCELKAPELHINPKTNLYMHLTKIRKIREFIQKSSLQFKTVDEMHIYPRVLIFSSSHFQFHGNSLSEAIFAKVHDNDFENDKVVIETADSLREVDLILWMQIRLDGSKIYQVTFVVNSRSRHKEALAYLVLMLKAIPVSSMDQEFDY